MRVLAPTLRCRQGLRYWYLIPFFTLVYGPILLVTRFAGTVAGVIHVRELKEKLRAIELPSSLVGERGAYDWVDGRVQPVGALSTD